MSNPRQNFHEDCEAGLNQCVNLLLQALYIDKCLAAHFDRDDMALAGFSKFFKTLSDKHQAQVNDLKAYQNKRGGRILLRRIEEPNPQSWNSGLDGMEEALKVEKNINQCLLHLSSCGKAIGDPQIVGFLKKNYLSPQVTLIKKISSHIAKLIQLQGNLGEYMYDKNF